MKKLVLLLLLFSCQEENLKTLELKIGQKYQEGTIFYIFNENDPEYIEGETHGYIVSEEIGEFSWGCEDIPLSQFNVEGFYNTEVIIANCGLENAAGECYLTGWWLPSFEEWLLLIASNVLLTHTMDEYYWTSTKATYFEAYCIRPSDENIIAKHVNYSLKTLGIKQF